MRQDGDYRTLFQVLGFNNVSIDTLITILSHIKTQDQYQEVVNSLKQINHSNTAHSLKIEATYQSHILKQEMEINKFRKYHGLKIPSSIDYYDLNKFQSFTNEDREKLHQYKPNTMGEASEISGVTPSSLMQLLLYVNKYYKQNKDVHTK